MSDVRLWQIKGEEKTLVATVPVENGEVHWLADQTVLLTHFQRESDPKPIPLIVTTVVATDENLTMQVPPTMEELMTMTLSQDKNTYGFTVVPPRAPKTYGEHDLGDPGWRVYLPHSCDEWEIAGSYQGTPYEEAVAELETFITEAQVALAALKAKQAFGGDQ